MSIEALAAKQNPDGGWPYIRGKSWTEPTVYAVMALLAEGEMHSSARGCRWLAAAQRRDGGWAPQAAVDQSTWVTGLAALLPPESIGVARHEAAIRWLMGTTGQETSFEYRVRQWLLGNATPPESEFAGWPWIPGAAAWVGPTAIAILSLEKEHRRRPSTAIRDRVQAGRQYLLRHTCQEGGWNHGSARALGYASEPYPETTGMALASFRGVQSPQIARAVAVARRFLNECRSLDALNWLRLGLLAHGELPPDYRPPGDLACRTVSDTSVDLLLTGRGRNFFWDLA